MSLPPFNGMNSRPWRSCRSLTRLARSNALASILIFTTAFVLLCNILMLITHGAIYLPNPWSQSNSHHSNVDPSSGPPDHNLTIETKLAAAHSSSYSSPQLELNLEQLQDMVSQTKGYFVRDFSLGLGWNNVRYIIEAALIQARILNRTAILPSFVYARSCEYNIAVCADHATMVNRGDAIGWEEWRELPIEQQMGWRIPITLMLNVTHLRRHQPVLLVSEYLRLHNLSVDVEGSNGAWDRISYHANANIFETDPSRKPDLFTIENAWFDPYPIIRVDAIPEDMKSRGRWKSDGGDADRGERGSWPAMRKTKAYLQLEAALPEGQSILGWDQARAALETSADPENDMNQEKKAPLWDVSNDEKLEKVIRLNGWEVLYTFQGPGGMEYTKAVNDPVREVAPRKSLRGFRDDFRDVTADVVVLAGETHLNRKPGNIRFTSTDARDEFARLSLHGVQPPDKVLDLARRFDERMMELNGGRLWMGAHMRRGDFVMHGWAMEDNLKTHFTRIRSRLDAGRDILNTITENNIRTYDIPDAAVDYSVLDYEPPPKDFKFYLATDEREPENLDYFTNNGAILAYDLLTVEDRQNFGWPLLFTDVLAIVEQATLVRASYFYGHLMSSVAGGVLNMRAAKGADPRTALLD